MRIKTDTTIKTALAIGFGGVLMGFAVLYYWPNTQAAKYRQNVKNESQILKNQLETLSSTTQNRIFQTPDVSPVDSLKDCAAIKDRIKETSEAVDLFSKRTAAISEIDYFTLSDKYDHARVTQIQTKDISNQTQEVLANYQKLVEYLMITNTARASFEAASRFTDDPAFLAQRIESVRILNSLSAALDQLQNSQPPPELKSTKKELTELITQARQGMVELHGNRPDNAVQIIDLATASYDNDIRNNIYQATILSHTLTDVNNLPDKAESFSDL